MIHHHQCVLGIILLVAASAVTIPTTVTAQNREGAVELGVNTGPFLVLMTGGREIVGNFGLALEPYAAYSLSDQLSVGATAFFYTPIYEGSEQTSITYVGAFAHLNYHFDAESPFYLGGKIGSFKSNREEQFAVGIHTGLQYFVAQHLSLAGQLELMTSIGSRETGFLGCLSLGIAYHIQ